MSTNKKFFSLILSMAMVFAMFSFNASADSIPSSVAAKYRSNIISQAQSYLGVPYVYGGMSRSGVDCSGLSLLVYREAGFMAWNNYAHYTGSIKTSLENAGCSSSTSPQHIGCVFFSNSYGHMGIYVGNNQIIHAPGSGQTVCYGTASSTTRYYYKPVSWMY